MAACAEQVDVAAAGQQLDLGCLGGEGRRITSGRAQAVQPGDAPGSSSPGAADASRASSRRATASSCRTLPQVNDRRNDPSVDGARIPPNTSVMAPYRSTSMSSMLSAPAAMPATRQGIFRPGSLWGSRECGHWP